MLKLRLNGIERELKSFTFNGGERHIQINQEGIPDVINSIKVISLPKNSDDIMDLMLLVDAAKRLKNANKPRLVIEMCYFPFARQDRVCNPGESFSLGVFAKMINSLGADKVIISDPHSDVTPALIENSVVEDQCNCYIHCIHNHLKNQILVCPDAGAEKKIMTIAKERGLQVIHARKVRDTATGNIVETSVDSSLDYTGMDLIIIDDICDGGRTFIELAKVLRANHKPASISLHVTHGIFSQGKDVFKGLIDNVSATFDWTRE